MQNQNRPTPSNAAALADRFPDYPATPTAIAATVTAADSHAHGYGQAAADLIAWMAANSDDLQSLDVIAIAQTHRWMRDSQAAAARAGH